MRTAAAGFFAVGLVVQGVAQAPVISSFQGDSLLSWTNAADSNALYHVEWASDAGGPWYRSFQRIASVDGVDASRFEVPVPVFFRVVMATNDPQGMVWIDGGDYEIGEALTMAVPVHTSRVTGFWMDEMEVTKGKWDEVCVWATNHGYAFDGAAQGKGKSHPVQCVSWYDAAKWCNARSEKEQLPPMYYTTAFLSTVYRTGQVDVINTAVAWNRNGYRLPTETEWEAAARGGRQRRRFPWGGDTIQHARANYIALEGVVGDTSPTQGHHPDFSAGVGTYTSPAGSFPPNGCGLHDMAGNVHEWCWDWYGPYLAEYRVNPRGPAAGANRVCRGGSWNEWANMQRCSERANAPPGFVIDDGGFRCVRNP